MLEYPKGPMGSKTVWGGFYADVKLRRRFGLSHRSARGAATALSLHFPTVFFSVGDGVLRKFSIARPEFSNTSAFSSGNTRIDSSRKKCSNIFVHCRIFVVTAVVPR